MKTNPRCANKECRERFTPNYFGRKFCFKDECNDMEQERKKSAPKLKRSPIRKVSEKRQKQNKEYLNKRKEFLIGKVCPVTNKPATEIHHMNGRNGKRLNDESEWLAVTRSGHRWIHEHPKEAREKGWLK